ncbi:type IV secretory system conjugative DNA transfer family protein [Microlunatus antarcticus]|uniref:Type IV secretion system protein VirD4 n=1 Tax=Microlunatus antarcticus TaxID=53388 RepID=A0A7W5P6G6_9ACTN|nr:type IV secretion system protein VirD4 [Microlunatus antarcticus]
MPWDRTVGVLGPQGSGKTLDLLVPALLDAPGAALVTTTKPDDLYLSWTHRSRNSLGGLDRPCVVADPFGLAQHLTPLVWDPIAGCGDPWVAQRRAHAFCAGLGAGDSTGGGTSDASRFYTAEAAKVTAAFLHAAALAGHTLDQLLRWVADPTAAVEPVHILRRHPGAAPQWHGLLHAALHGDERTAANTATTVQQALGLFFQPALRARCTPTPDRPATDLDDLVRRRGTVYLLGRDDPYAPATPLLTAIAEDVLDTALRHANSSPHGRLCPPLLACLDELPSIAPLPTLQTRMANERALGISFIWAAQTYTQLVTRFGDTGALTLLGLTNVLAVFGGTSDPILTRRLTDLAGHTRTPRTSWSHGPTRNGTTSSDDLPTLTADEIRLLPPGRALVFADQARPLIARLERCTNGPRGRQLLADQTQLRRRPGQAGDA